jgi:hypothetical protein
MSTKEDTNVIDEKKKQENGFKPNFKDFIKNYIYSIAFTICFSIFIIGGLGLYTTKVAQANILPDDVELAPYTIYDRIVDDKPIDINVMRPNFWSEFYDTFSQKVTFNSQEYLDRFSDTFLCYFKKKSNLSNGLSSNGFLYFSKVYDNILANNYLLINTFFSYLSFFPESIVMLLYGFFGIFLWLAIYGLTFLSSIVHHFINIPKLFRDDPVDSEKWGYKPKQIALSFLWMFVGLFSAFICPIFFTIYGLLSPLTASYKIKETGKNNGLFDFIKDTFAYKKYFFFILATISLFSNGSKYLGYSAVFGIIIAVIFAYFMGLYENQMPKSGDDGFTSNISEDITISPVKKLNKAKLVKVCENIPIDTELDGSPNPGNFRQVSKPKSGGDITNPSIPVNQTTEIMPSQSGGKKLKSKPMNFTKKYNIRLV